MFYHFNSLFRLSLSLSIVFLEILPKAYNCLLKMVTSPSKTKVKVASDSLWPHGLIQSMEFSRPEYWRGWPFLSPGDHPNLGIKPRSLSLQADSLPAEPQGKAKNTGGGRLSLSSRSSQPKNRTRISCIAGGFFTDWAIREALKHKDHSN